jgi:hypothetical protein
VDMFDPAQVTHNANYNYINTSAVYPAPDNHCNGTPYQSACTSAPGLHDVNGKNPRFVDTTRNLGRWAQANHGGNGSTADAVAVFAGTPAAELGDRIISLLSYVREGFRPQNPAYRTAAHDGTTIGAVPMTPAPRHFGAINNPVVVE